MFLTQGEVNCLLHTTQMILTHLKVNMPKSLSVHQTTLLIFPKFCSSKTRNLEVIPESSHPFIPHILLVIKLCHIQSLNLCPTYYSSSFSIVLLYAKLVLFHFPQCWQLPFKMTVISFLKFYSSSLLLLPTG